MMSGVGVTRDSCNVDAMTKGAPIRRDIMDSIFYIIDAYVDEI
jgi:hypothetical protein